MAKGGGIWKIAGSASATEKATLWRGKRQKKHLRILRNLRAATTLARLGACVNARALWRCGRAAIARAHRGAMLAAARCINCAARASIIAGTAALLAKRNAGVSKRKS